MTVIPEIDDCKLCRRRIPWEWRPAVLVAGTPLAGTGVWRSQLIDGRCPACVSALETQRQKALEALLLRTKLINLLGGEKPYREFRFERYSVAPGNRLAY